MGDVEIDRRLYSAFNRKTKEKIKSVYLLDEKIDMSLIGRASKGLAQLCADTICEESYFETAKRVSEMTGAAISPQGVWNILKGLTEMLVKDKVPETSKKKARVIFEEADGVWLKLQRDDREIHGRSAEMKIACFYSGSRPTSLGSNKFECIDKKYVVGFENAKDFFVKKEKYISQYYDLKETDMRLISGDGASWVKRFCHNPVHMCYMQLDVYHRNKALVAAGLSWGEQNIILKMFKNGDVHKCLSYIKNLILLAANDNRKQRKLLNLYEYYRSNIDYLIPISERGVRIPKPPEGVFYRNLGTMEASVGNVAARRMKGRKASFSLAGATRLASLIGYKLSKELHEKVERITRNEIPAIHFTEALTKVNVLSAAAVTQVVGKGYLPKSSSFIVGKHTEITKEVIRAIKNTGLPI
jgi:hypothetical protein